MTRLVHTDPFCEAFVAATFEDASDRLITKHLFVPLPLIQNALKKCPIYLLLMQACVCYQLWLTFGSVLLIATSKASFRDSHSSCILLPTTHCPSIFHVDFQGFYNRRGFSQCHLSFFRHPWVTGFSARVPLSSMPGRTLLLQFSLHRVLLFI